MDLFHILLNIHLFNANEIIYAAEPWTPESEAQVILEPAEGILRIVSDDLIFEYFLDIASARKLLHNSQHSNLCMRDQCLHIIEYALRNT